MPTASRPVRPVGWTGPTGASVTAHLTFMAAADNRRGRAQSIVSGVMEEIAWPPSDDGFTGVELTIVGGLDLFKDGYRARYLIDDGTNVRVYYVATYHPTERNIGLKHMRTGIFDPECDGPHTLYQLKITGETPETL